MKTSAPRIASARPPVRWARLVVAASSALTGVRSARSAETMPRESTTVRSPMPASSRILAIATPAAPAPEITARRSASGRPTTCAALRSAASSTIAVPCWSSWNTGMSSRSCRRRSTSKQRGAEMSSRLMPPKPGASRTTVSTSSSTSVQSRQTGTASTPPNCLNSTALPSITGSAASGPMSPRPEDGGAVGDHRDGVRLPGVVHRELRTLGDGGADLCDTRRVGQGQVGAVAQRDRRAHLHLAAAVQVEDRRPTSGGVAFEGLGGDELP